MDPVRFCAITTAPVFIGMVKTLSPKNTSLIEITKNLFFFTDVAKMTLLDLEPALPFCTHLIYGYAGINAETNKLTSLDPAADVDQGHFRLVTQLKRKYPGLKVLLSVGGGADIPAAENNKYLSVLETSGSRIAFVNSAYSLVKTYEFDGLDLAWQFPADRPIKIKSGLKKFWANVKATVGITKGPIDEKAAEHKEQFSALVREMRQAFAPDHLIVSLTVNPNVNLASECEEDFFK